jgi:hypothetical protein
MKTTISQFLRTPQIVLRRVLRAGVLIVLILGQRADAQEVLLEINGTAPVETLYVVSRMEDVNSDGLPDVLGGAHGSGGYRARLYSGATGALLLEVVGPLSSSFGYSVADAGDFNGDGIQDFVVGAPSDDINQVLGSIRIYSSADGALLHERYGDFFGEQLGNRVAGLGDLNGDGYDEVGVTSRNLRRVRILAGPDGHGFRQHVMGDTNSTHPSIASVGDIDGDSVPDYAVGWPRDSTGGGLTGTVVVFSGRTGAQIHMVHGPTPVGPESTGSHLGFSVAGVGDMNGDGIPDFAAGGPGALELHLSSNTGVVRVYSGSDASILYDLDGANETLAATAGKFGFQIAGGGDLNGDGVPDFLVGAPSDAPSSGSISAYSGRTGERLWRIVGPQSSSRLHRCAILGDLDGDSRAEFAVGNPLDSTGGNSAGRITVYAGARGDLFRYCDASDTSLGAPMRLEHWGALGLENNLFRLYSDSAIPDLMSLFVYGRRTPSLPFGDGFRCLGPPVIRLGALVKVNPLGHVELDLDFTQPPLSGGPNEILPGSSWSFQLFCRDPQGPGGTGFNLSDALHVIFPP